MVHMPTTLTYCQRFAVTAFLIILVTNPKVRVDRVIFALDAVRCCRAAALYTLRVTALTRRRVGSVNEVVHATLRRTPLILPVVLARRTVRQTLGRTGLAQFMARHTALTHIHSIIIIIMLH